MTRRSHRAACHCGACAIEFEADLAAGTGRCNCSFCLKARNWAVIVPPADVRNVTGRETMGDYRFGTGQAAHLFCRTCGLAPFGHGDVPEMGGEFWSVAVACIEGLSDAERAAIPIRFFNGRDDAWMETPEVVSFL